MQTRKRTSKNSASKASSKQDKGKESLPSSNLKSPESGKSSEAVMPVFSSWHHGQAKKFKGTLQAAKSLFVSSEEEVLLSEIPQSTSKSSSKKSKKKTLVSECVNFERDTTSPFGFEKFNDEKGKSIGISNFVFDREEDEPLKIVKV